MKLALMLMLCLALRGSFVWATPTHTTGLHAVPAPGTVTVDGVLADWDLSGSTLICADVENMKGNHSAQVAMMYDTENLYMALQWKDPSPIGNSHDPKVDDAGWAGDCVQLRIVTDRIVSVTAWYYSADREPCIVLNYGKGEDVYAGGSRKLMQVKGCLLTGGAEMACVKDADIPSAGLGSPLQTGPGRVKGYAQEIKLPWALITESKRYKPGEQFACGVELLWGADPGNGSPKRVADNVRPGALPADESIFYLSKDEWGPVTLEAKGHILLPEPAWVRTVEQKSHAGPLRITQFRGGADAAVSYTFDDGSQNQLDIAVPILNEFGVKGTFFIVSGVVRDKKDDPMLKGAVRSGNGGLSWEELRAMAEMGHEIGNHSLTHRNLLKERDPAILESEIIDSAKLIASKLGQAPVSFCYAGNSRNDTVRTVVMQQHVADRRYCVGYGGKDFTVAIANGYIDKAIDKHEWIVPMIHGMEEGYSPLDADVLRGHLRYARKLGTRLWIDTFGNIARYEKERETAILKLITQANKEVVFTLSVPLDAALYSHPLTVAVPTPGYTARDVVVEQESTAPQPVKVLNEQILVDVVPGKKSATVKWK